MNDEPLDWKAAWYALDHDTKAELASLREQLADREAALDAGDKDAGLSDGGSMWRFWSMQCQTIADVNKNLREQLADAERQRDAFRAVLEGALYGDIDGIAKNSVEQSRKLGAAVAELTMHQRDTAWASALEEAAQWHDHQAKIASSDAHIREHNLHLKSAAFLRAAATISCALIPQPAPTISPAEAAMVLLDDLVLALEADFTAQGREAGRRWSVASDAAERAPSAMDRPTPIQMIRAALRTIAEEKP